MIAAYSVACGVLPLVFQPAAMARSAIDLAASGSFDSTSTLAARSSPLRRLALAGFAAFAAFVFAAPSARAADFDIFCFAARPAVMGITFVVLFFLDIGVLLS